MPCHNCAKARQATANAMRAAVSGNVREAAEQSKQAAQAIAAKASDEAARVRAMLTRR
jgi:hypothetical protein